MKLARNILSGWTFIAVNTAIVLFMTPYIIRMIGIANFGVWALLLTVITYLNLLDFGSQQAQARFLSRAIGQGDSEHFRDIFSNTAILFFVVGLLIVCAAVFLAQSGERFFNIPTPEQEAFRKILKVLGIAVGLEFMVKSYGGSLAARERLDIINLIEIAGAVMQAIVVFGALTLGMGLVGMAYGVAGVILAKVLAYVATAHFSYPHARVSLDRYSPAILRQLLGYGSISYVIIVTDLIRTNVGIPMVASFLGTKDTAFYAIAAQFIFYFSLTSRSVASTFLPRISRLEGQGNWPELREQFFIGTRIVSSVVMFIGSSMMIFGSKFIELWLGADFDVSYKLLLILTPAAMLMLLQSVSTNFLFATSNHGLYAKINFAESICGLVLGLVLIKRLGVYGMALGTFVPVALLRLFGQPAITLRLLGIGSRQYFAGAYRRSLLFGCAYSLVALLSFQLLKTYIGSLWLFFVMAGCFMCLAAVLGYLMCLTAAERIMVRDYVEKWYVGRQQSLS